MVGYDLNIRFQVTVTVYLDELDVTISTVVLVRRFMHVQLNYKCGISGLAVFLLNSSPCGIQA